MKINDYGKIAVSILALATFTRAFVFSFFLKDSGLLNLTVVSAIANATTTVGFWLGSSSGSQQKDNVIAKQAERAP
jgi:hypothetical protein